MADGKDIVRNGTAALIASMTGYGRAEREDGGSRITAELRSVNNRYLDVQVKLPRSLSALEQRIRKTVQDRFARGRIDVFLNRSEDRAAQCRVALDTALAGRYVEAFGQLKDRYGLGGEVDLRLLAGLPDLIVREEAQEDPEAAWPAVEDVLVRAAAGLRAMRVSEGAALLRDIDGRLGRIEELGASIRRQSPRSVETARARMAEAVARLAGDQVDPARLAQEIAFLAERTDITEELTRLASHVGQFRSMTSSPQRDGVGRKLDFLLQEMVREANTIASKAMDSGISHDVVELKAELEKVREQVQNIE